MKAILSIALLSCLAVLYCDAATVECPPKNESDVTLLPHPENCDEYFACNHGVPILMKCPGGLHFNEKLRVCDWPEAAQCERGTH